MTDQEKRMPFYGEGVDDECPICLEAMPLKNWNNEGRVHMTCCGNYHCTACANHLTRHSDEVDAELDSLSLDPNSDPVRLKELLVQSEILSKCPLCRGKIPTTDEECFEYSLRNAQLGNKEAQYNMGSFYTKGLGVKLDYSKALFWFEKCAKQGVVAAMYSCGNLFKLGKGCQRSESQAVFWMMKAADAGYPPAQRTLGLYYLDGDGVEQNNDKAFQLFKMSSEQGYDRATAYLGYCYLHGVGVEKDVDEALRLLELGAEKGQRLAQFHLGTMRIKNRNYSEGMELLRKCAEQDYPPALRLVGFDLVTNVPGRNNDINIKVKGDCTVPAGTRYLRRAAAHGDQKAIRLVAETESIWSSKCANCRKEKSENGKLLKCSKCKLMHYCSKECQIAHWKNGHKQDCCDQKW